ncbi:MAG: glycosyltransferase family 9 protein [Desulfatiglans sp.]|jgi:ADP-heptose:LPS heptosyltransferase|nr:glycosyltransferase family 9 protein [Desulfatiglans sp.]
MKILIIRAGALGDTLMLMPSIKAMRDEHEVIIAGRSPGIEYLDPWVEKCIDLERGEWHKLYSTHARFDTLLTTPDQVTGFLNDTDNIIRDNLSHLFPGAKIDIFPPFPEPDSETHVAIYMAKAIKSTGIRIDPHAAFYEAYKKPVIRAKTGKGKRIVLHPGSGSIKKNYPPELWLDLLRCIREKIMTTPYEINVLIGPAEEGIIKAFDNNADIYISQDREHLLSILDNTCLYIGHDSGVTHLAAMMGINTIALFRKSRVKNWGPVGPNVKIIEEKDGTKSAQNKTFALVLEIIRQMGDICT